MTKKITTIAAAILAFGITGAAFAQGTATPVVDQKQANQQARIDQGVASGQLNAKETRRLDKREAKLQADKTAAKADGTVTKAERRKLRREAKRDSKAIHAQKHDAQTAAPATTTVAPVQTK